MIRKAIVVEWIIVDEIILLHFFSFLVLVVA